MKGFAFFGLIWALILISACGGDSGSLSGAGSLAGTWVRCAQFETHSERTELSFDAGKLKYRKTEYLRKDCSGSVGSYDKVREGTYSVGNDVSTRPGQKEIDLVIDGTIYTYTSYKVDGNALYLDLRGAGAMNGRTPEGRILDLDDGVFDRLQ